MSSLAAASMLVARALCSTTQRTCSASCCRVAVNLSLDTVSPRSSVTYYCYYIIIIIIKYNSYDYYLGSLQPPVAHPPVQAGLRAAPGRGALQLEDLARGAGQHGLHLGGLARSPDEDTAGRNCGYKHE